MCTEVEAREAARQCGANEEQNTRQMWASLWGKWASIGLQAYKTAAQTYARSGAAPAAEVMGFPFIPLFFPVVSPALMAIAFISRPLESSVAVLTVVLGITSDSIWIRRITQESTPDTHFLKEFREPLKKTL